MPGFRKPKKIWPHASHRCDNCLKPLSSNPDMYFTVTPAFAVNGRRYPNQLLFCHPWCANMHVRKTRRTLATDLDHRWKTYKPKYQKLGVPETMMQSLKKAHQDLDGATYDDIRGIRKPSVLTSFGEHIPYSKDNEDDMEEEETEWTEI